MDKFTPPLLTGAPPEGPNTLVVGTCELTDKSMTYPIDPKYTVVRHHDTVSGNISFYALRYGAKWLKDLISMPGSNLIYALASDLDEARKRLVKMEALLQAAKDVHASRFAAELEGLSEVIANTPDIGLRDLLERRVFYHFGDLQEAIFAIDPEWKGISSQEPAPEVES